MAKCTDLSTYRFGRLVVQSRAANSESGKTQWICICDCAVASGSRSRFVARSDNLTSGKTTSCGCAKVGRPAKDASAAQLPDNDASKKPQIRISIITSECGFKGKQYGFAIARGAGITNERGYEAINSVVRPNACGPINNHLKRMLELLARTGVIPEQCGRTYIKWMADCGITHDATQVGGMSNVDYRREQMTGEKE